MPSERATHCETALFDRLEPGEEVMVWHHPGVSCRARITGRKPNGMVAAVLWNEVGRPHRIAEYPEWLRGAFVEKQ